MVLYEWFTCLNGWLRWSFKIISVYFILLQKGKLKIDSRKTRFGVIEYKVKDCTE